MAEAAVVVVVAFVEAVVRASVLVAVASASVEAFVAVIDASFCVSVAFVAAVAEASLAGSLVVGFASWFPSILAISSRRPKLEAGAANVPRSKNDTIKVTKVDHRILTTLFVNVVLGAGEQNRGSGYRSYGQISAIGVLSTRCLKIERETNESARGRQY